MLNDLPLTVHKFKGLSLQMKIACQVPFCSKKTDHDDQHTDEFLLVDKKVTENAAGGLEVLPLLATRNPAMNWILPIAMLCISITTPD